MLALNLIVFGMSVRYADAIHPALCLSPALCSASACNFSGGQLNLTCCSNSALSGSALAYNVTGNSTPLNFTSTIFRPEFLQHLGYKEDQSEATPKDLSTLLAAMEETSHAIAFLAQQQEVQTATVREFMGKQSAEMSEANIARFDEINRIRDSDSPATTPASLMKSLGNFIGFSGPLISKRRRSTSSDGSTNVGTASNGDSESQSGSDTASDHKRKTGAIGGGVGQLCKIQDDSDLEEVYNLDSDIES